MNVSQFICTFSLAISLLACTPSTVEDYISEVNTLSSKGDTEAAVIILKNATVDFPRNAHFRAELGRIYLDTGQFDAAEKELNRALEYGAEADLIMPLLVKTNYYLNNYDTVVNLQDRSQVVDPTSLSTINLFAYISALRTLQPGESAALPEALLLGDDLVLAKIYKDLHENNGKAATELLASFKQEKHELIEKKLVTAVVLMKQKDYEQAAIKYEEILTTYPTLFVVRAQLTELYINSGQNDKAESQANILLNYAANNPYFNLLKARVLFQKDDYEMAILHAEKSIQNGLDIGVARIIVGVSAYYQNNMEMAYRALKVAATKLPDNQKVKRLLAKVQLDLGYIVEAKNTLLSINQTDQIDANLFSETGVKLALEGDMALAKAFLVKANEIDENNALNQLREGIIRLSENDDSGIENIKKSVEQDNAPNEAWLRLVQAHLKSNNGDAALTVANQLIEQRPVDGHVLKGLVHYRLEQLDESEAAFKYVLSLEPKHLGANKALLTLYNKRLAFEQAMLQVKAILSVAPADIETMVTLLSLSAQQNNLAQAEEILLEHKNNNTSLAEPYIALAALYNLKKEPSKAIELLEDKIDSLSVPGLLVLGDTYISLKDVESAKNTYEFWRKTYPENQTGWVRSIGVAELESDYSRALALTEQALVQFDNAERFQTLKLHYLIKLKRLSEAKQLESRLSRNNAEVDDLNLYRGQIALAEDQFDKAEDYLGKHYEMKPSFAVAFLYAEALSVNNKMPQASTMLEAELVKLPVDFQAKARNAVAEFYAINGDFEKASEHYLLLSEAIPDSFIVFNNLAWALSQTGELEAAEKHANTALSISPGNHLVLDTLGWIQFQAGKLDEAQANLSEAVVKHPSDTVRIHLINVLVKQQEMDQARYFAARLESDAAKAEGRRILEGLK